MRTWAHSLVITARPKLVGLTPQQSSQRQTVKSLTEQGLEAPAKPADFESRPKEAVEESFNPDEPDTEVGGRDMRGGSYPGYWHYGRYIWWSDGVVYRGMHWHPRSYSPVAYDEDDS